MAKKLKNYFISRYFIRALIIGIVTQIIDIAIGKLLFGDLDINYRIVGGLLFAVVPFAWVGVCDAAIPTLGRFVSYLPFYYLFFIPTSITGLPITSELAEYLNRSFLLPDWLEVMLSALIRLAAALVFFCIVRLIWKLVRYLRIWYDQKVSQVLNSDRRSTRIWGKILKYGVFPGIGVSLFAICAGNALMYISAAVVVIVGFLANQSHVMIALVFIALAVLFAVWFLGLLATLYGSAFFYTSYKHWLIYSPIYIVISFIYSLPFGNPNNCFDFFFSKVNLSRSIEAVMGIAIFMAVWFLIFTAIFAVKALFAKYDREYLKAKQERAQKSTADANGEY